MSIKPTVLILGASGMLGSMMVDVFARDSIFNIIATVRTKEMLKVLQKNYPKVDWVIFDAEKDSLTKLKPSLEKSPWIINCIGIIKPYIHDGNPTEVERAIRINALLPNSLAEAATMYKSRVLQIATDCVYSGHKGNYQEKDYHDALDVYGKTKSLGEVQAQCMSHFRCSIIGPELKTHTSLLDWFLNQPTQAELKGFTNHQWNGLTTLHFAKLCRGIVTNNPSLEIVQHIVPSDVVTKSQLLDIFAQTFSRKDLKITPVAAAQAVDRSLSTQHKTLNKQLWQLMGYSKPLSIKQMVKELAQYEFHVPLVYAHFH